METDEFPKPRTWVPGRPETLPEGHPIRVALGSSAPPAKVRVGTLFAWHWGRRHRPQS